MTRTIDNPIDKTAAQWLAQLQDCEVTVDEMLAWQRWMRADDRHAAAFGRMEETWEMLQKASPERIEALSAREVRQPRGGFRMYALAASIAVTAIILTWAFTASNPLPWMQTDTQVLQTAIGENRVRGLPDGSQVTLGGDTRIEVRFDTHARRLTLSSGEALFAVAKDRNRPFTVRAGDATVTAVGTAFNIRRSDDRVVVAVVEGRVTVEPVKSFAPLQWLHTKPSISPVRLDAGQQTIANRAGVQSPAPLKDSAVVTAWRSGLMSFQREPLRYVLQDVNRYAAKPIVFDDDSIGELRVTGTVMKNNMQEWIGSLENAFGVRAVEEPERIVLRR